MTKYIVRGGVALAVASVIALEGFVLDRSAAYIDGCVTNEVRVSPSELCYAVQECSGGEERVCITGPEGKLNYLQFGVGNNSRLRVRTGWFDNTATVDDVVIPDLDR